MKKTRLLSIFVLAAALLLCCIGVSGCTTQQPDEPTEPDPSDPSEPNEPNEPNEPSEPSEPADPVPEKVIYIVKVSDPDGNPLSGAEVTLVSGGGEIVRTNDAGEAALALVEGSYAVSVALEGYTAGEASYAFAADATTLEVVLHPAIVEHDYTVTVRDDAGAALAGAQVTIFTEDSIGGTAVTDQSGKVTFTLAEASYSVTVTLEEYTSEAAYVFADGATTLDVVLAPVPFEGIELIVNNACAYTIVYPDGVQVRISDGAAALSAQIARRTGVTLAVAADAAAAGEYEILIGQTNRPESAAAMAALPAHGYSVTLVGNKIVVVGSDPTMTALALYRLESEVFENAKLCGKGLLRIPADMALTQSYDAPLSVKDKMESEYAVTASTEFVLHGEQYTDMIRIAQGAASDGTYAYFSVRRAGKDGVGGVIYKYHLQTHEKIAVSEEIAFGHGNDLTYDSKNHRIIVSHGLDENHVLTLVDPDTLTVIDRVVIGPSGSSISYNPWTDSYAMGEGNKLEFMDANFKATKLVYRKDYAAQGYVNQGMGSDQSFIYLPLSYSDKSKNLIVVFDWQGKAVKEIPLPEPNESESFFVVDDTYYITFYHKKKDAGTYLHEVTFEIVYEDRK